MVVSPFGVALALAVLWVILCRATVESKFRAVFTMCILLEGFVNTGYFIRVAETTYKSADFLQAVLCLMSVFVIAKSRKFSTCGIVSLCAVLLVIALNLVSLTYIPYDGMVRSFDALDRVSTEYYAKPTVDLQSFKTAIRVAVFIYNALILKQILSRTEWQGIRRWIIEVGAGVIAYCWVEFILKNVLRINPKPIIDAVFGMSVSGDMLLERSGILTVHGFASEPSQLAMILFYYLVFFAISQSDVKIGRWTGLLASSGMVVLFLSGSFRFVGMAPWIVVLYLIGKRIDYGKVLALCLLGAMGTVAWYSGAFDYYLVRFANLWSFISSGTMVLISSEALRFNTVVEAFASFRHRPVLGLGLGTTFAYGFLPSILATTGIVGTVVWYWVVFGQIGGVRFGTRQFFVVTVLSIAWIYTSAIDVAYSSIVLACAIEMSFARTHTSWVADSQRVDRYPTEAGSTD